MARDVTGYMLCEFGCGEVAKYDLPAPDGRMCCSKTAEGCPQNNPEKKPSPPKAKGTKSLVPDTLFETKPNDTKPRHWERKHDDDARIPLKIRLDEDHVVDLENITIQLAKMASSDEENEKLRLIVKKLNHICKHLAEERDFAKYEIYCKQNKLRG